MSPMQHQQLGSRPMQGSLAGQQRMQHACPPLPAFLLRRGMALSVLRPSAASAAAGHGHATASTADGTAAAACAPFPLSVFGPMPSPTPLKLGRTALALPTPACGRQWGGGTRVPTSRVEPTGMHAPLVPHCYTGSTTHSATGELLTQVGAHNSGRAHTRQSAHATCYPRAGPRRVCSRSQRCTFTLAPRPCSTRLTPTPASHAISANPRIHTWSPLLPGADLFI